MENTKAELKVLTRNLRRNEENDPYCKHSMSEFLFTAGEKSGRDNGSRSIQEIYNPGDLVVYDNRDKTGLVLQVSPDALKVLN